MRAPERRSRYQALRHPVLRQYDEQPAGNVAQPVLSSMITGLTRTEDAQPGSSSAPRGSHLLQSNKRSPSGLSSGTGFPAGLDDAGPGLPVVVGHIGYRSADQYPRV